jgi:hypothetical protein
VIDAIKGRRKKRCQGFYFFALAALRSGLRQRNRRSRVRIPPGRNFFRNLCINCNADLCNLIRIVIVWIWVKQRSQNFILKIVLPSTICFIHFSTSKTLTGHTCMLVCMYTCMHVCMHVGTVAVRPCLALIDVRRWDIYKLDLKAGNDKTDDFFLSLFSWNNWHKNLSESVFFQYRRCNCFFSPKPRFDIVDEEHRNLV